MDGPSASGDSDRTSGVNRIFNSRGPTSTLLEEPQRPGRQEDALITKTVWDKGNPERQCLGDVMGQRQAEGPPGNDGGRALSGRRLQAVPLTCR